MDLKTLITFTSKFFAQVKKFCMKKLMILIILYINRLKPLFSYKKYIGKLFIISQEKGKNIPFPILLNRLHFFCKQRYRRRESKHCSKARYISEMYGHFICRFEAVPRYSSAIFRSVLSIFCHLTYHV